MKLKLQYAIKAGNVPYWPFSPSKHKMHTITAIQS